MLERARATTLYGRLAEYPAFLQFVRYAMVGVLNVALFLGIFNLLLWAGAHTIAANAVAFFLTSLNSFALNKLWAFKDPRRQAVLRQYLVFVGFTMVGLGINTGVLYLLLIPLEPYGTLGKNAAALGAIPFSVAWNFLTYRRWTFKPGAHEGSGASVGSPRSSAR